MDAAVPSAGGGAAAASNREVPVRGYAGTPAHYIGSVYCEVCHEEQTLTFFNTKMGKVFLEKPGDPISRLGCEGCHGPGSNHAISGGGVGMGGLFAFRDGPDQFVARNNQKCVVCHDEAFWHGRVRGARLMACFDCHTIMVRESPHFQLAAQMVVDPIPRRTWGIVAGLGVIIGICAILCSLVSRRWRASHRADRGAAPR